MDIANQTLAFIFKFIFWIHLAVLLAFIAYYIAKWIDARLEGDIY